MSLETTINLNVDFYNNKYIMINAKQYDSSSRWIAIACYNQGKIFTLNANEHVVYVRYKKADGYEVFNSCRINHKGEALVELTEQMLAADGICYADLIVVNKGNAILNVDTGEVITTDDSPILSTMAFCVNVHESPFDNSIIESSYELGALNEALQKANADYTEIIQLTKSYAVGNAGGIRENEDEDNAKYYCGLSVESANDASDSETNAKTYMNNAKTYMDNSNTYMNNAKASETNAKASEDNAKLSETKSKTSETNATTSEMNAKTSEANALNNANIAKSYAVGSTGTRDGEDTDNARYYYNLIKSMINGIETGFIPMGTISFSELATVEKTAGYVYNIRDDFETDDTFAEGSGKHYTAGTNVYFTATGYWDCFGGSSSPIASADEVKDYLGIV